MTSVCPQNGNDSIRNYDMQIWLQWLPHFGKFMNKGNRWGRAGKKGSSSKSTIQTDVIHKFPYMIRWSGREKRVALARLVWLHNAHSCQSTVGNANIHLKLWRLFKIMCQSNLVRRFMDGSQLVFECMFIYECVCVLGIMCMYVIAAYFM